MEELLGAPVAKAITADLQNRVEALKARGVTPKLAIVRLGEAAGDMAYERGACTRMGKVGVEVACHALPESTSQGELEALLDALSADASVHGVLLMRPLPAHLDESKVAAHLSATKDVDGMTVGSLAHVFSGKGAGFAPCTAEAVMAILEHYGVELVGKQAVVLGRSLVVGKPAAQLLLSQNATVTVCHSKTQDLASHTKQADLIVSCMGRAHSVGNDMLADDGRVQVLIDVSTNDDGQGSITGDVDTESIVEANVRVTPVPRGVGSVTTSILARHVVESAEQSSCL